MARTKQWTQNLGKQVKKIGPLTAQPVINPHELERLKGRAADLGLIIHAQPKAGKRKGGKK